MKQNILGFDALNILGEMLWHTATSDTSIVQVSRDHMESVRGYARRFLSHRTSPRFLEVAAYAHITGYYLADEHGWHATLSDISVETLALGARHAAQLGLDVDCVRRVAVDFHDLPFSDGEFDIVYISSALHHTLRWKMVLQELFRVTANGGLLVLQNEPCKREFCLYKFPTNRPESFRLAEVELDKLGILKTIAEPYPGSRPESLFGMIENQAMVLSEMLSIMRSQGVLENLDIDSTICMSSLDHELLASSRNEMTLAYKIRNELVSRMKSVRAVTTDTDIATGIRLPDDAELGALASVTAKAIVSLPHRYSKDYAVACAAIFGGAISAVVRKGGGPADRSQTGGLRYSGGERKGVSIGFPPVLNTILNLAADLVPDIQTANPDEIAAYFPSTMWTHGGNADVRYLVLTIPEGRILLRPMTEPGRFAVLLRIYGAPAPEPFRIILRINGDEIAGVDVYQADSFLLRGELPVHSGAPELSVAIARKDGVPFGSMPPITVAAVRVVCVAYG